MLLFLLICRTRNFTRTSLFSSSPVDCRKLECFSVSTVWFVCFSSLNRRELEKERISSRAIEENYNREKKRNRETEEKQSKAIFDRETKIQQMKDAFLQSFEIFKNEKKKYSEKIMQRRNKHRQVGFHIIHNCLEKMVFSSFTKIELEEKKVLVNDNS